MPADPLSTVFAALSDPTRRGMLAQIASGETTLKGLAAPYDMSQAAVAKHLKVLESAGLVSRGKDAQYRPCRLEAAPLKDAYGWIGEYARFWDRSLDAMEDYLAHIQGKTPSN